MTTPADIVRAGFDHHLWATLSLLDTLETLEPARLDDRIDGTYGSILQTMTHLVDADDRYLQRLTMPVLPPYEDRGTQPIPELRSRIQAHAPRWNAVLAQLDAGELDARIAQREDWPETPHAEGLLLLQAVHHGNDHRTQVCSTLGALGLEAPELDGWGFWLAERLGG